MSVYLKDHNKIFFRKFIAILLVIIIVVTIMAIKLKEQEEDDKIAVNVYEVNINKFDKNQTNTAKIKKSNFLKIINNSTPIWDLPFKENKFNAVYAINKSSENDGYFISGLYDYTSNAITKVDKNGIEIWTRVFGRGDKVEYIGETKRHIVFGDLVIDKKSNQVVKKLKYDQIQAFDSGILISDKENNLRFFDNELNLKWEKYIDTDMLEKITNLGLQRDMSYKRTEEIKKVKLIQQIKKIKDGNFLTYMLDRGLVKFDLNGNIVFEKKLTNVNYIEIFVANDGFIYTIGKMNPHGTPYSGVASVIKFDTYGNVVWSKILHSEDGDNYVSYAMTDYKDGFLLVVKKTEVKDKKAWIKFIEFDSNGNKIDENMVSNYPGETTIQSLTTMYNGDVLVYGNVYYTQRHNKQKVVENKIVDYVDYDYTNGLFIKIPADTPLGKQKIKPFDEEFVME